jgi:hypothetical protein
VLCYPCRQDFLFPFDGAKVRRISEPAMDFYLLCAQTVPFVDEGQRMWQIMFFFMILHQTACYFEYIPYLCSGIFKE